MTTQTLEAEKFEALRERYDAIDGVAQAGLTTADGRLLRQWRGPLAFDTRLLVPLALRHLPDEHTALVRQ
jgi:hypothetical protein